MGKAEQDALLAEFGDVPAEPTRPKIAAPEALKPPPSSMRDDLMAEFAPEYERAPTIKVQSLNPSTLQSLGAELAEQVRAEAVADGLTEEEAGRKAADVFARTMVVGEGADAEDVTRALGAYVGQDTLKKTMTRVFGQRLYEAPAREPTQTERDDAQRKLERDFFASTGRQQFDKTWNATPESAPMEMTEDEVKPWLQRAKDTAEYMGLSAATGGLLPAMDLARGAWNMAAPKEYEVGPLVDGVTPAGPMGAMEIASDYLNDRDVRTLAAGMGPAYAATGLIANTPIGDVVTAVEKYTPIPKVLRTMGDALKSQGYDIEIEPYAVSKFMDAARSYDAFDAANDYAETGDRASVDGVAYKDLPAILRGETINTALFREAAKRGDADLAALVPYLSREDVVLDKQIQSLPVGVVARIQTDLAPTDRELLDTYKTRLNATKWRGTDQGQAMMRLMSAGLLTPVGNGNSLIVKPSRLQEAMRIAGVAWNALQEADVGVDPFAADTVGGAVAALPGAVPSAALRAGEYIGIPGMKEAREKFSASRLFNRRGLETMITSGAYDDLMESAGLLGGKDYAAIYGPESSWLSRTLADTANPDYSSRWLLDTYTRAGGDPNSATARALGTADIVAQFVVPAEELAIAPLMRATSMANRMRAARTVARELGGTSKEARAAMLASLPEITGSTDAIEGVNKTLITRALEGIRNGTLNPEKIGPSARKQVEETLINIGVPREQVAGVWNDLADRHARILDESKVVEMTGGPATQALRDTEAYRARMSELDAFVRTKNLTPNDREVARAFLEASAFNAYDRGVVGSPEEYFARHSWERGVEGEVPEGALLSADGVPAPDIEAKAPGISGLRRSMLDAAGDDTAFDPKAYAERKEVCKLTGHCNAAAYVVQKRYGGDLLSTKVNGETHVWNRLPDGTEIDLTGSQYGGDGFHPVATKGKVVPARATVNPRFKAFEQRVANSPALKSESGGTVHGAISRGTPDTVNVPNPDYAAWEARVAALSAEVDALKATPAEVPNPARAEWEAKGKATAAEVADLRASSNREMAGLQARRESLQKNPRPDDPDWEAEVEEVNDRIGEITRTTSVNPALAAKEAELAAMRANPPAATLPTDPNGVVGAKAEALARLRRFKIPKEVPQPSDVSRWLIQLFRTGNVRTALHEGAHLLDLTMGEEWTKQAAKALGFTDAEIAEAFAEGMDTRLLSREGGDAPDNIRTRIREAIAEAGTRALRGTLRPGSQLGNVFEDLREAFVDVWRRVRNEPAITTPAFKKFWDQQFRPNDANMEIAARILDSREVPGEYGTKVFVGGSDAPPNPELDALKKRRAGLDANPRPDDADWRAEFETVRAQIGEMQRQAPVQTEIREGAQRRVGQARNAANVQRATPEMRQSLGLTDDVAEVPLYDLVARAMGYVGTERFRRAWGSGALEGLTTRTAVPVARATRIKRDVAAYRKAVLGGDPPKPTLINGVETFTLNRDQQAGVRRMLADLANQPVSVTLPERLQDMFADLSQLTRDEWNSIVDHQLDVRAGAGAWRDRKAELAAVSGATRLVDMAVDAVRDWTGDDAVDYIRDKFVVANQNADYVNPVVREAMAATDREIAQAAASVKNDVVARQRGGASWQQAVTAMAREARPEVVPVEALDDLAKVQRLATVPDLDIAVFSKAVPDIDKLFRATDIRATEQTLQEQRALSVLDAVGRRMHEDGMDFGAALGDSGVTLDEANDAMSWVQEGIRRRVAAVEDLGGDIVATVAGSKDRQVWSGIEDPAARSRTKRAAYAALYSGDWATLFQITTRLGNQAAQGGYTARAGFDQGAVALHILTRLRARQALSNLSRRLAVAGVVGGEDIANALRTGRRGDMPYRPASLADDVRPVTPTEYIDDVQHYIQAELGWKDKHTIALDTPEGPPDNRGQDAPGQRTARGSVNLAAYNDAQRILQSMGFKVGKMAAWTPLDMPDGARLLLPAPMADGLRETIDRVAPTGGAFAPGAARLGELVPNTSQMPRVDVPAVQAAVNVIGSTFGYAFGMMKTGLTTGIGPVFKPAFYMGNFLGGFFQLYQGVGLVKALDIARKPLMPGVEGATIRRVMARMWADGQGAAGRSMFTPMEYGFFDSVGRWHSDQSIAAGAVAAGLNSSLAKVEFGRSIIEDIKANEPTLYNRLVDSPKAKAAIGAIVGGVTAGPGGAALGAGIGAMLSRSWQDFLTEATTGVDNFYRVSIYVDALKRGVPELEAAEAARRITFDYNEMTDFERDYIRKGVLFYSYQRRNQDLFWWTLLNHPSRVVAQLRGLRGLQQANLGEDSEMYVPEWADGRPIVGLRGALEEGHSANAMRGEVTLLPNMGVTSAMGFWINALGLTHGDLGGVAGEFANKVNPWIQSAFVLSTMVDPYTNRSIENYNTIPNWFYEMDRNLTGGMIVRDLFQAVPSQTRDPSRESFDGAPQWVVNPGSKAAARWWWVFRNLTPGGSTMDTITAMQRADVGQTLLNDEQGIGEAAVDLSADVARVYGREPIPGHDDTELPRTGITEGEEFAGWLGFKPLAVLTRVQALSGLQQRRESELKDAARDLRDTEDNRYR